MTVRCKLITNDRAVCLSEILYPSEIPLVFLLYDQSLGPGTQTSILLPTINKYVSADGLPFLFISYSWELNYTSLFDYFI